jgi:pimeloyl-ACP methyl ester carboxylesterase
VRRPDGVIVESSFPSGRAVYRGNPVIRAMSVFATYRFDVADRLNAAGAPVLLLHGTDDSIIPFELGRALHDNLTVPKQLDALANYDHNDLIDRSHAPYWGPIGAFVDRVRRVRPPC